MHKPRIIFFDIDGTLIDMEKKRITERTLDALRRLQQNGILLAIATGRSPLIVPKFDGVEFDVFLTYNGSFCYNMTRRYFRQPHPAAGCADADSKRRSAWSSGVGCRTDAAPLQRNG